jgi:general stress protein CsbA
MAILNIVSWLGLPLLVILVFGITRAKYRALAISTLLIAIPLSVLLASNNNNANVIRNFFMGMVMFGTPLLFHAWLVSFIKQINLTNHDPLARPRR